MEARLGGQRTPVTCNPLQQEPKPEGVASCNKSPVQERRSPVLRDHDYGETGQIGNEAALNRSRGARGSAGWSNCEGSTLLASCSHRGRASISNFYKKFDQNIKEKFDQNIKEKFDQKWLQQEQ